MQVRTLVSLRGSNHCLKEGSWMWASFLVPTKRAITPAKDPWRQELSRERIWERWKESNAGHVFHVIVEAGWRVLQGFPKTCPARDPAFAWCICLRGCHTRGVAETTEIYYLTVVDATSPVSVNPQGWSFCRLEKESVSWFSSNCWWFAGKFCKPLASLQRLLSLAHSILCVFTLSSPGTCLCVQIFIRTSVMLDEALPNDFILTWWPR